MRSCEEYELFINLCLDNMLPSEEQQELMKHLEVCPACRERYEQLAIMTAALGQMDEPVPEELHERIMEAVNRQNPEKKVVPFRKRRWYRGLAGAAACAVIAVVAARFVPQLEFDVGSTAGDSASVEAVTVPTAAPQISENASDKLPAESYVPSNDTVSVPSVPSVPSAPQTDREEMETASGTTNAFTGQISEDLPPLRKENENDENEYRVTTVRKWRKVTGKREALPDWVDLHSVYEAELEGTVREYVEIAAWAEEYWVDQLTACGFLVEVMEEQEVVEDGEHMLLIFFWEE